MSFEVVREFDWEHAAVVPDLRFDYGELRFIAYGWTPDLVGFVIAFTLRGAVRRIISARRFGRKELEVYGPG